MNVLITGATSFLGAETARAFLAAGCEVWAPVRPSSKRLGFLPVHERLHRVDIDMNEIRRLPETGIPSPEVCVHFAWSGEGVRGRMDPETQVQNVRNTLALIRVMGETGCRRFLFAGSQAEYGVTHMGPYGTEARTKTGRCDQSIDPQRQRRKCPASRTW